MFKKSLNFMTFKFFKNCLYLFDKLKAIDVLANMFTCTKDVY